MPDTPAFDGATLIGVLHHVPGDEAKAALLHAIARRLKPGAPLVLAGNHRRYADHPRLLDAWQQRWRMKGATPDAVRAQLAKILQGADPPASEDAVFGLLSDAGFDAPLRFSRACSGCVDRGAARVMERGGRPGAVGQTRPARRRSSRRATRFAYAPSALGMMSFPPPLPASTCSPSIT